MPQRKPPPPPPEKGILDTIVSMLDGIEDHPWAKKAREIYYGPEHREAIPEFAKMKKPKEVGHFDPFFGLFGPEQRPPAPPPATASRRKPT